MEKGGEGIIIIINNNNNNNRGYALLYAEERKNIVHVDGCRRAGVLFQPLAVETLGGWSPHAISAIRTIGSHLGSRRGLAPAEHRYYIH